MDLRILDIRLQDNGKPFKALVDIKLGELIIRDFRVIQQDGHKAYVTMPQSSWRGPGGRIQYKTLIVMSDELKWKIDSAILAEYQKTEAEHDRNII